MVTYVTLSTWKINHLQSFFEIKNVHKGEEMKKEKR